LLWGAALLAVSVGCASKHWQYEPSARRAMVERPAIRLGVIAPFDDKRPSPDQESTNAAWLIPLWPMSPMTLYHPEARGEAGTRADEEQVAPPSPREQSLQRQLSVVVDAAERTRIQAELKSLETQRQSALRLRTGDSLASLLAASVADELAASGVVGEVVLVPSVRAATSSGKAQPDLLIRGTVDHVEERRETISYGLSIAGPVLWLFLPARDVSYRLAYRIDLLDRDGNLLASHVYRGARDRSSQWIWGGAAFGHVYTQYLPGMARTLNAQAAEDIEAILNTFPEEYWQTLAQLRQQGGTK
jgi:hypothetical protein